MKHGFVFVVVITFGLIGCAQKETATDRMTPGEKIAAGKVHFQYTCATCHGTTAGGITYLGKDLRNNEFIRSQSDDALVAFLLNGRPAEDPTNRSGVRMPPKGGSPALTEQDIRNIVAYLRTLQ